MGFLNLPRLATRSSAAVNHDKKATNRNKLLEEILTPHICGSSWTTFTPTPQDVVASRVMGIATAD